MPYTSQHKERTREKIVAAARLLFNQRGFLDVSIDDVMAEAGKEIPWGRLGLPEDIGKAAVYLCSEDADYVTGETLTVDGGIRLKGYLDHQAPETEQEKPSA